MTNPPGTPDHLWDALTANMASLKKAYAPYKKRKPILLFDLQEQFVYVYSAKEFIAEMSPRDQANLLPAYAEANKNKSTIVFARDNVARRLCSYPIDLN